MGALLWLSAIGLQARFPVFSANSGWPTWQMLADLRSIPLEPVASENTVYDRRLPHGFPRPRVPQENPMRAEVVELGRYLFYDKRLSGNGTQSCESGHIQALAFSDGKTTPVGSTGQMLERNSPALVNVAYNATLTWANPVLTELERQVMVTMFAELRVELGIAGREEAVLDRLRADERYPQLFAAAFPGDPEPVTLHNIVQALSAFIRSLISGDLSYDHYVAGHTDALSHRRSGAWNSFLARSWNATAVTPVSTSPPRPFTPTAPFRRRCFRTTVCTIWTDRAPTRAGIAGSTRSRETPKTWDVSGLQRSGTSA